MYNFWVKKYEFRLKELIQKRINIAVFRYVDIYIFLIFKSCFYFDKNFMNLREIVWWN